EARQKLETDLGELRGVLDRAEAAPAEWMSAREQEHDALSEEVRAKLDRIEKTRRVLGAILPHLQVAARALSTLEKLQTAAHHFVPAHAVVHAEAARMST